MTTLFEICVIAWMFSPIILTMVVGHYRTKAKYQKLIIEEQEKTIETLKNIDLQVSAEPLPTR